MLNRGSRGRQPSKVRGGCIGRKRFAQIKTCGRKYLNIGLCYLSMEPNPLDLKTRPVAHCSQEFSGIAMVPASVLIGLGSLSPWRTRA